MVLGKGRKRWRKGEGEKGGFVEGGEKVTDVREEKDKLCGRGSDGWKGKERCVIWKGKWMKELGEREKDRKGKGGGRGIVSSGGKVMEGKELIMERWW